MSEREQAVTKPQTLKTAEITRQKIPSFDALQRLTGSERILYLQRTIGNQAVQRLLYADSFPAKLQRQADLDEQDQTDSEVAENAEAEDFSLNGDFPAMEFRPDLKGKKVKVAVALPAPPPIRIPLEPLQESPNYGDFPERQTPGVVMAKRLPGVIQREEAKGKPKIELGVNYPFSLSLALTCSDCAPVRFKNLLGEAQMFTDWQLQLSWKKQPGQGSEPSYSMYAFQSAITVFKEDIKLNSGIWLNQLTLALMPYFVSSNDKSGPYKGGFQPQAQLRFLEYKFLEFNVAINTSGEYTCPYRDQNGQEVSGEWKWFKSAGGSATITAAF